MRIAFLTKSLQFSLNFFRIVGPVRNDFSIIVIADDQQLITIVDLISELEGSGFQFFHIRANGQRIVDEQDYPSRRQIRRETFDVLLNAVIEQRKVFSRYRICGSIRARCNYIHGCSCRARRMRPPAGLRE